MESAFKNIVMVIVQSDKKLLVHQRSDSKKEYPGLYGLGAGGKVNDGESPMMAASRELKEELNLETSVVRLFDFLFIRGHSRVNVYRTTMVEDVKIVPYQEFKWYGWMETDEIDKELLAKELLCPDTRVAYERFKREFI